MSLKRNPGFASYEQLLRLRSQNQSPLNSHKLKIEFPCGSKLGNKSLHHSRFGWPCTLNTLQKLSGAHLAIMFLLNVPHAGDTDRKSVANQSPTDSLNIINWPDSEQFEDQGLSCWNVDVQSYCTARAQHGWPCQQLRLSWKVDSACKLLWTRRVQTAKPARSPASQLPPGLFCSAAWCGRGLIPKTLLSDLSSLAHSTHGLSPPKRRAMLHSECSRSGHDKPIPSGDLHPADEPVGFHVKPPPVMHRRPAACPVKHERPSLRLGSSLRIEFGARASCSTFKCY